MTYPCEVKTLKNDGEKRLNAFEMKCLPQILRIPWNAKKTNDWVLETSGVERSLFVQIKHMAHEAFTTNNKVYAKLYDYLLITMM